MSIKNIYLSVTKYYKTNTNKKPYNNKKKRIEKKKAIIFKY